jgi:hypothetical protein
MSAPLLHINNNWALGADALQWILLRTRVTGWRPVAFVSSTKQILARCMREKGVPAEDAKRLLDALPDTFKEWVGSRRGLVTDDKTTPRLPHIAPAQPQPLTIQSS